MKKSCNEDGCNNPVWSKGKCINHSPRKRIYPKSITKEQIDKIYTDTLEMQEFFITIWDKRPHKSEVSGQILFYPISSAYFHHILPKERYPNLRFSEDNIILLSLDEHSNVENDVYKYEEINNRRDYLINKYNL